MTKALELVVVDGDGWEADFAADVRAGLTQHPRRLECRYLYDREGALLFEAICELPEYYLTRTERGILAERAPEIAARLQGPTSLVELGSGSASKTRLLIEALLARHGALQYVPVDLSRKMLEESSRALLESYPGLSVLAVAAEYAAGLRYLAERPRGQRHPAQGRGERPPQGTGAGSRLILWLGSNVGNLHRDEAVDFLAGLRETMGPRDRFLMGVDMRKDRATLERAYDDSRGVTARFILNLLARINRELGGRFDLSAFSHRARYDEEAGRVEIFLESRRNQAVPIAALDLEVRLDAGERIHVENSYKYSPEEIDALAAAAGFGLEARWLDPAARFSVNFLAPASG